MTPNNDEVICPNCVHQFRAIPQNVQQLMLDVGFKPPFTNPAQPEPVAHDVIAGVLFDFMAWLTSRPKRIMLSSADDASPAVDAIRDFAKMRGLSLDDAKVQDWQEALAQTEQCQCPNCKVILHSSDCAVHSGPAYPAGGCDCGAQQEPAAVVSGYYGGQCVILPIDPARIFNSNTALYTKDQL